MDLTDPIPGIPALLEELEGILAGLTTVTCLGHMKWLGAFMCIAPVQRSLVGAATTEEEGFRLVERTEALDPAIRTLLIADDANEALVREALARGCNGIYFASGLFMPALRGWPAAASTTPSRWRRYCGSSRHRPRSNR